MRIIVRGFIVLGLVACVVSIVYVVNEEIGLPFLGGGEATITSDTEACATDIKNGLTWLQKDIGVFTEVTDRHAQVVINSGRIEKRHRGVQGSSGSRGFWFRPQVDDGVCKLVFYRRTSRGPAGTSSSRGRFGAVPLANCTCE